MSGPLRSQAYFFSSRPESGAQNVSADGSAFSVQFDTPLRVPPEASYCELGLAAASIWNTSPNISPAFSNNTLAGTILGTPFTLTFAEGLYSLDAVNAEIVRQIPNGISFKPVESQQKTELDLNADVLIDFSAPSSIVSLLGFPPSAGVVGSPTLITKTLSPSTAQLNRNNTLLIRSDIVSGGLPVNSNARGIVGEVPINVVPGSLIQYQPQNILWFDASELIGNSRQNIRFELVNEAEQRVPTSGDAYSFVLMLRWS